MVKRVWKREFHLDHFWLEHRQAEDFLLCQWQSSPSVHAGYALYRCLLAGYFVATLALSALSSAGPKWLVYLTNWGYLACTLQAVLSAGFLVARLARDRGRDGEADPAPEPMRLVYKVFWASHTIAVVVAYGVTVTYWLTIYNPSKHRLDAVNVLVHAGNSAVMTLDLWMVRHPMRLLHAYLPLSFTLSFFLFSVTYFLAGGTSRDGTPYIYAMLDWQRPGRTILCCTVGLVFLLGMHVAAWGLSLLRRRLHQSLEPRREHAWPHDTVPSPGSSV
ncbi:protein rolling stone-like [Bacillus rossius redtenbacheri]|uniref:protein rolling stone-like n=1 Tax=Bacillus rossius redtenbacheri TaxID=93214 RepID=UPI002FDD7369